MLIEFLEKIKLLPLIIIAIGVIILKKGVTVYGLRKRIRSYVDVTESEKRRILITIKRKILGIFEREKTYELKYMRIKNSIREVKEYFDIVLKNQEYIIREIDDSIFFNINKKIIIYLRDSAPIFNKISVRFLPETELKSLIREMLDLDIIELEERDFKTFTEKINYNRLLKKRNLKKRN